MALALCTLVASTALAAEKQNAVLFAMDMEGADTTESVGSIAAMGDNLYMLTYKALYLWSPGMENPQSICDNVFLDNYNPDNKPEGALSVTDLFSDGKAIYGLFSGTGEVNRLTDENGNFAVTPVCTLDVGFMHYVGPDYTDYGSFISLVKQDDFLYAIAYVSGAETSGQEVMKFDLSTGKVIKHEASEINSFCAYQSGKLLALANNAEGSYNEETGEMRLEQLCTVDCETLQPTVLCDANSHSDVGICYNADSDTVYFSSESAVYAMEGVTGTPRLAAYLPSRTWMGSGISYALLQSGMYVVSTYNAVNVRALDMPNLAQGALKIYGEYGSSQHNAIVYGHPDMLFTTTSEWLDGIEALTNAMISGESNVDVLKLTADSTPVQRLIAKGYAMDLSAYPAIMEVAAKMDPSLLAPYTVDGKLYAIPSNLAAYNFGYNPKALEELDITADDLPTSIPGLLDFIANFYYDYGEDHPEVALFDDINIRYNLMYRYMNFYAAQQLKDTGALRFDTDAFRSFLKGLAAIDFTEIDPYALLGEKFWDDAEGQNEFYQKTSLFSMYYDISGPTSFGDRNYMQVLPLSLEEGGDPIFPASVDVLMINPRTTRTEQAVLYVAEYAGNPQKETAAYTLFPDNSEPLVNATYETDKANLEEYVANLQKQLDAASEENKSQIKSELEYAQTELSNYEKYKFTVTADMVTEYRQKVAPYIYQMQLNPLNDYSGKEGNQFNSLIRQYLDGALDTDRFITEMDNRIKMMQLEDM